MASKTQAVTEASSGKQQLRWWFAGAREHRAVFWAIVASLGLVQALAHRMLIDHDGVVYLDIAENYARGAWKSAINGFYSPLYSWLLAIVFRVLKLPRSWDSTALHLVNFAGYLAAYACFEFFLRRLIRNEEGNLYSEHQSAGLPENAWPIAGLGLFLYISLAMANLSGHSGQGDPGSTPDIFVVLFVFLAMGLLLRMQSGQARKGTYAAFGAALGLGYLAKTPILALSPIFLAIAGFISLRQRSGRLAFLLAPICFALVAGPWIAALSHTYGRFMYGDAGRLNLRWRVGPQENPTEWGGQTEESEKLVHPPRRLSVDPPVYEFATPIAGTFPLWYGTSYWLEGWKWRFSRAGQMRILRQSYREYREYLFFLKDYLVLLVFLIILQGSVAGYFKAFLRRWVLWLPAISGLSMFALVRVEPRYVAPFWGLLWICLLAAARLPRNELVRRFARYAVIATAVVTVMFFVRGAVIDSHSILRRPEQVEVAEGLRKLGVLEGQSLATIGIPRDSYYWARRDGLRVIAEIPTPNVNQYWFASCETQQRVRSLFAQAGAVAIVTDAMPAAVNFPEYSVPVNFPGWTRIGNSSYFFFPLKTGSASTNGVPGDSNVSCGK